MKRKHKVLSWWATIILVLVGFVAVAGITALVLFLMGRFNEEIVRPQDMSFSSEVDGEGYYDDSGHLRLASNAYITLSTTTEEVTQDQVTLYLDGVRGRTSNAVLKVPERVTLNKPFQVELMLDADGFVHGGQTVIRAISDNVTLDYLDLQVLVDKPVQESEFQLRLPNASNGSVVLGSVFKLETVYGTDESSKKAFSLDGEEKQIFYAPSNVYVNYDWETDTFEAVKESGTNYDVVTAYVFANSFFQKQTLDRFESVKNDKRALAIAVTNYLQNSTIRQGEDTYFTKDIQIFVTGAQVSVVNVANQGKTLTGTKDKFFVLTTRTSSEDSNQGTLGATIREDEGSENLDGLLKNLGIKIPKDANFRIDNRRVSDLNVAGKVMKVVSTALPDGTNKVEITEEDFDFAHYEKYVTADSNTNYYILPNTDGTPTGYFWRLAGLDTNQKTLAINYFFTNSNDGSFQAFFDFDPNGKNPEKTINFVAGAHREDPPRWSNTDPINFEMWFDDAGNPKSAPIDLSNFLGAKPGNNVFNETRFFLYTPSDVDLERYFSVKAGQIYEKYYENDEKLSIGNQENISGYKLYELDNSNLLSIKEKVADNVEVSVLVAIIKTGLDGDVELTEDGKYQIVSLSNLKRINIDSFLSIARMTPTFEFTRNVKVAEDGGKYYIPAINRGANDERLRVLNFRLDYECAEDIESSWESDAKKIEDAFENEQLGIVCTDGQDEYAWQYIYRNGKPTEMFLNGNELSTEGTRQKTLHFLVELVIEESLFSAIESGDGRIVPEVDIHLVLKFNDGHNPHQKQITGEHEGATLNDFWIYYQIPRTLSAGYMTNTAINGSKKISVEIGQGAGGVGDVKMTWGDYTLPEGSDIQQMFDFINTNLNYTLLDQHNQDISIDPLDPSKGLYRILFTQDNDEGVLVFNEQQNSLTNFLSTGKPNVQARLIVKVNDRDGKTYLENEYIDFDVTTEGVTKIEKENDGPLITDEGQRYVDNPDNASVTITKDLQPNDDNALDLTKLVRVYLGDSGTPYPAENMKVQFNRTFITRMSQENSKDLAKILDINGEEAAEGEDMSKWLGTDLATLKVRLPLNDTVTLELIVFDESGTRFNIPLNLRLRKQVEIGNGFETYNRKNGFADYLVKKSNSDSLALFADAEYDLAELFPLTASVGDGYSWKGASCVDYSSSGLLSVTDGKLKIKQVSQFTTVEFALYYEGSVAKYTLNTGRLMLYINPNIAIVENEPFLNLNEIGTKGKFDSHFKFYKATTFITDVINGTKQPTDLSGDDVLKLDDLGFVFNNVTPNLNGQTRKFVNIQKTNDNSSWEYLFAEQKVEISLNLGDVIQQTYAIMSGAGSSAPSVNAVRLQKVGEEYQSVLCENGQGVQISIGIGFGEDEKATAKEVLSRTEDGNSTIQVVKYKPNGADAEKTYVVLAINTNYYIKKDFTYENCTGELQNTTGKIYTGNNLSILFDENNTLTIKSTPADANGNRNTTIFLTIDVIVSRMGEKFVYYGVNNKGEYGDGAFTKNSNTEISVNNRIYNHFGDTELGMLLSNPKAAGAFQELYAGQEYTLVHYLNHTSQNQDALSADKGIYGFYLDYAALELAKNTSKIQFSTRAYQIVENREVQLSDANLISRSDNNFTINHLSKDFENTYVEITLTIRQAQNVVFTMTYRIRIVPDFEKGKVTRPFAEDAEYLDELATSYVGAGTFKQDEEDVPGFGKYVINLDETFNGTNSNGEVSGTRFAEPTVDKNIYSGTGTVVGAYSISSATANGAQIAELDNNAYFTYTLKGANLEIVLKQQGVQLTIVVKKTYKIDDQNAFGAEQEYELRFGQGETYVYNAVKHKQNGDSVDSDVPEVSTGKYRQELKAGGNESLFTIELATGMPISSPVGELGFFIVGEASAALKTLDIPSDRVAFGSYAYLENKDTKTKVLHLQPKDSVEKDITLEIVFFTEQRIALRIELFVTSFYDITPNTEFVGGQTYDFVGESGIFKEILDTSAKDADGNPTKVTLGETYSMSLESAEKDATVSLLGKDVDKATLWKLDGNKIEFAHLPEDVTFKFTATISKNDNPYSFDLEITVKKSINAADADFYRFYQDANNKGFVLYSGLPVTLHIEGGTDTLTNIYNVYKQGSTAQAALPDKGTSGTYKFVVGEGESEEAQDSASFTVRSVAQNEEQVTEMFTIRYTFQSGNEPQPTDFSLDLTLRFEYSIAPSVTTTLHTPAPDGETYSNTEYLEGQQISKEEFKTKQFDNFFTSPVDDFAMKKDGESCNRVEVEPVEAVEDFANLLEQTWRIEIKSISNVSLAVSGAGVAQGFTTQTVRVLLDNKKVDSKEKWLAANTGDYSAYLNAQIGLNLTFALLDSTKDGTVEFAISVNSVGAQLVEKGLTVASTYKVQILHAGASVVSVATNPTNYEGNHETIYAEDLETFESKQLFEENRILQFNPKVSGDFDWDFKNKSGEIKTIHVEIAPEQVNTVVNLDVGKSMEGFEIDESKTNIASTFNASPIFTSRLVAVYAAGTENQKQILLNDNMNFVLVKATGVDANGQPTWETTKTSAGGGKPDIVKEVWKKFDEITLGETDLKEEARYKIAISRNFAGTDFASDANLIETNGQYAFLFDIDFEVKNATESASELHVFDLVAGTTYALLGNDATSSLNNQIHIRSTRRNEDYTAQMMKENSGRFDLQIYGFSSMPLLFAQASEGSVTYTTGLSGVENPYKDKHAQDLAIVAGQIHEALRSEKHTAEDGEWSYFTGLTPNAEMTKTGGSGINSSVSSNTYNYLVVRGGLENGREKDYDIIAQGCNNDGNHVMVKVSYSVGEIKQEYNLMFRVIPNTMTGETETSHLNSQVSFKTRLGNSGTLATTNYTRTFGKNQRVASNYDNIFEISKDDADKEELNLYNTTNNLSIVTAKLYGDEERYSFDASKFKFAYESNTSGRLDQDNIQYNSLGKTYHTTADNGNEGDPARLQQTTSSCTFNVSDSNIMLGEKYFYIDFENDFGYKGRFFFKIVASSNPRIKTVSNTVLQEGAIISVGTEFSAVDNDMSQDMFALESFKFQNGYWKTGDAKVIFDETQKGEDRTQVWNNIVSLDTTLTPNKIRIVLQLQSAIDVEGTQVSTFEQTRDVSDKTFNILDKNNKKWNYLADTTTKQKDLVAGDAVTEDDFKKLAGATVTIYLGFDNKAPGLQTISVTNKYCGDDGNEKTGAPTENLAVQYGMPTIHQPAFEKLPEGETKQKVNITLTNINAYGFQTKENVGDSGENQKTKLADLNSSYVSSAVGEMSVTEIKFFYNGKQIGSTIEQYKDPNKIVTDA